MNYIWVDKSVLENNNLGVEENSESGNFLFLKKVDDKWVLSQSHTLRRKRQDLSQLCERIQFLVDHGYKFKIQGEIKAEVEKDFFSSLQQKLNKLNLKVLQLHSLFCLPGRLLQIFFNNLPQGIEVNWDEPKFSVSYKESFTDYQKYKLPLPLTAYVIDHCTAGRKCALTINDDLRVDAIKLAAEYILKVFVGPSIWLTSSLEKLPWDGRFINYIDFTLAACVIPIASTISAIKLLAATFIHPSISFTKLED